MGEIADDSLSHASRVLDGVARARGQRLGLVHPEIAVAATAQMVWSLGCAGKFIWPVPDRGLRQRLHRVTASTLVIWGRQDSFVPASYADDFADLVDSKVVIVEDSGHLPQVEQFKQTAAIVDEFLS